MKHVNIVYRQKNYKSFKQNLTKKNKNMACGKINLKELQKSSYHKKRERSERAETLEKNRGVVCL